MSVSVERGDGRAVVSLLGDQDIATSHEVRRSLAELRDVPLVVVELARCTFIDSTVLGVLVSASRRIGETGGRLVIVNASGIVAKALEITGLAALLDADVSVNNLES